MAVMLVGEPEVGWGDVAEPQPVSKIGKINIKKPKTHLLIGYIPDYC